MANFASDEHLRNGQGWQAAKTLLPYDRYRLPGHQPPPVSRRTEESLRIKKGIQRSQGGEEPFRYPERPNTDKTFWRVESGAGWDGVSHRNADQVEDDLAGAGSSVAITARGDAVA